MLAVELSLSLLFFLHTSSAQISNAERRCARPCIPIRHCPYLVKLLKNPTIDDLKTLKKNTCRIINREPLVCCAKASLLPKRCGKPSLDNNRIHGGNETGIGRFPWMAVLAYNESGINDVRYLCGGSVIHERYILTAAHCLHPSQLGPKRLAYIRLGEYKLSTEIDCERTTSGEYCAPPARDYQVEEVILHPDYNTRASYSDDIALIRVTEKINARGTEWVEPICLPPSSLNAKLVSGQREPEVAGWGFTEKGTTSDTMLGVSVPFFDRDECNTTYQGEITEQQMCLGGRAGQDSCGGDSGGPLVVIGPQGPPYLQIGLVSYGPSHCGQIDVPGVYTSISHYREWIDLNIKP